MNVIRTTQITLARQRGGILQGFKLCDKSNTTLLVTYLLNWTIITLIAHNWQLFAALNRLKTSFYYRQKKRGSRIRVKDYHQREDGGNMKFFSIAQKEYKYIII